MKKIYLLFVAATLAACSVEPVETQGVDSLNATVAGNKNKVAALEVVETLDYPETLCIGEKGTFTFKFEGKRNGATPLKLDVYIDDPETVEIDFDWFNIYQTNSQGEGPQEQEVFYTFDAKGTYEMRYQIGGSPIEFTVDVDKCETELICESTYLKSELKLNEHYDGQADGGNNWGWAALLDLEEGETETFELWAGAGQNDTSKGKLVGTATVDYDGEVSINLSEGYTTSSEPQVFVADELPVKRPAPGHFRDFKEVIADGQFYLIVHLEEVCWEE